MLMVCFLESLSVTQQDKNKSESICIETSIVRTVIVWGPRPLEPKEIDGLLVSPGKASSLLTDYLITGYPLRSELAQENSFKSNPPYL